MGIFGRNIERTYGVRAELATPPAPPLSILSPWSPQDSIVTWAIDDALGGLLDSSAVPITRETALRVPGVKRGHGLTCSMLADIPFFEMDGDERTTEQPKWLTNSASGVSPYHRMFGAASDWFFNGWACFGFTEDKDDCLHIPYGMWKMDPETGVIFVESDRVDEKYKAHLVAVPLGFGENGLLVDGVDTIRQARNVEAAYQQRLDNPIPLTVLTMDADRWDGSTPEERANLRDEWNEGRKKNATAMKPTWLQVDMPGQVQTDLYETGRNAVRLDIANHIGLPASILEGVRQGGGGGGTEIRYSGVQNGGSRSELWDFGLAKRMLRAFEARMSLDDICPPGLSIRGDLSNFQAIPAPNTTPTSED